MIHLTLNTGHAVAQDLAQIPDAVTGTLSHLLRSGGQLSPPFGAFRVELARQQGGAIYTIYRGREPIVTCGLAIDQDSAAEIWELIEGLYLQLGDTSEVRYGNALPEMPATVPWLGVVLLPHMILQTPQDIGWIGDFEWCFAAALIRDL